MKKYILSALTILLLLASISSVTYAWFAYVNKKSLAEFEAGVLAVSLLKDDVTVTQDIEIDSLAYLDYENEFKINDDNMTNIMASSHRFDIILDEESPQAKVNITFDETQLDDGLIYLVIYEGMDLDETATLTTDYAQLIQTIISGSSTKTDELASIDAYNAQALLTMQQLSLTKNSTITYQVVVWGDYDAVLNQSAYLDQNYTLTMHVEIVNAKGDFQ